MDKDDGFGGNPRAVTYDSVGSEPLGMYKHVQYPKPWVGLTDDEMKQCSYDAEGFMVDREVAMRAVETKIKEKNSGS